MTDKKSEINSSIIRVDARSAFFLTTAEKKQNYIFQAVQLMFIFQQNIQQKSAFCHNSQNDKNGKIYKERSKVYKSSQIIKKIRRKIGRYTLYRVFIAMETKVNSTLSQKNYLKLIINVLISSLLGDILYSKRKLQNFQ